VRLALAGFGAAPTWRPTQAQVDQNRVWASSGQPMVLVHVPITQLLRRTDYSGDPAELRRVEVLAEALRRGAPMEPIIGYAAIEPGKFWVHDGNHRVAAAASLGMTRVPMLIERAELRHAEVSLPRVRGLHGARR